MYKSFSFHVSSRKARAAMVLIFFLPALLLAQTKTLGLTKKRNGNDENGYILFSPIGTDTTYLMNKCGQKLHFWKTQHTPGMSVYLKTDGHLLKSGTYTDTTFGFAGGRGGIIEEYDWSGNLIWKYKVFNDSLCQHHDVYPMPNGNVLVLAWHSISKNKALALGRAQSNFSNAQQELWGERIIELKPIGSDSAEVVWQWDLFDHLIQDKDSTLPNFGIVQAHPERMDINYALNLKTFDWIHANSLDYNEDLDQIVISAHNISEFWIIDHSTTTAEARSSAGGTFNKGGDLLYRWGNPQAYKYGSASDRKLFRQHNARWIRNGMRDSGAIMLFNNGWDRDTAYSSIDIIRTPILPNGAYQSALPYGPANPAWIYTDSVKTRFYSQIISGAEMLPNGNVLICSGVQGRFFEVTPQKKTVWEYRNPVSPAGIQTDGQTPGNNQVFRCSYYPSQYPAFSGKTLTSKGTIEKASYPYACTYETVAPTVLGFRPGKRDTAILPNAILQVHMSEAVLKKAGSVYLYSNNALLETISINSDMVKIKNDTIFINHLKSFPVNARISVALSAGIVKDSSNNALLQGIDSGNWHFNTIRSYPTLVSRFPAHQSLLARRNQTLQLHFSKPVIKRPGAKIRIYENGIQKQVISVSSAQVQVNLSAVSIDPGFAYKANALVVVETDSCFRDSFGVVSAPLAYGEWYFRAADFPKTLNFSPRHQETEVASDALLQIEFSRTLSKDSVKQIRIFENGILRKSISTNDPALLFSGQQLSIQTGLTFGNAARIAVELPAGAFVDTFGLHFQGSDTADWHFVTLGKAGVQDAMKQVPYKIYPVPSNGRMTLELMHPLKGLEAFDMQGRIIPFLLTPENEQQYALQFPEQFKGLFVIRINGQWTAVVQVD